MVLSSSTVQFTNAKTLHIYSIIYANFDTLLVKKDTTGSKSGCDNFLLYNIFVVT